MGVCIPMRKLLCALGIVFLAGLLFSNLLFVLLNSKCPSISTYSKYFQPARWSFDTKSGTFEDTLIAGPNATVVLTWDPYYHIYRINEKPVIWIFWDKRPLSALIKLSLASVLCHNGEDFHLQLIYEDEVALWLDHVHPSFEHLIPAHKADYFRARILDKYGGIYIDAESVGWDNFWQLFHKLLLYDVINIDWQPDGDKMATTAMGPMRAHSHFTGRWVTNLRLLLDQKLFGLEEYTRNQSYGYPINQTEILREVVLPILDKLLNEKAHFKYLKMTGHKTFGQLIVSKYHPGTKISDIKDPFMFTSTELLMYYNTQLPGDIKTMTVNELLKSEYLIAELFRTSFKQCRDIIKLNIWGRSKVRRETKEYKIMPRSLPLTEDAELSAWINQYLSEHKLL